MCYFQQEETQRRHEESLAELKQRAAELGSPRSTESLNSLLDFTQIPSEASYITSSYASRGAGITKQCERCKVQVSSKTCVSDKNLIV